MKKLVFTLIFPVSTIVLLGILSSNVDFVLEAFIVFSIALFSLLPIFAALMLFIALIFNIFKSLVIRLAIKVAAEKRFEDTIASHFYFMQDMGPSISSVSVVAFFVNTDASVNRLVVMFFFGIGLKYVARRFRRAFYRNIRDRQGLTNDRPSNDCAP